MSIYQRIKDLANEKNVSIRELEKQLGFSNGAINKWKDKAPSDKLEAVADYFGVTVDYLLGKTSVKYTVEGGFYDQLGNFDPLGRDVSLRAATYNERAILLTTFNMLNNLEFLNGGAIGSTNIERMKYYTSDDYQKINDIEKEEIANLIIRLFSFLTTPHTKERNKAKKMVNRLIRELPDDFYNIDTSD